MLIEVLAWLTAVVAIAVGGTTLANGIREQSAASDARAAAVGWRHKTHAQLVAQRKALPILHERLRDRQRSSLPLIGEKSSGFAEARKRAAVAGREAGRKAGEAEGREDALSQRSAIEADGWYIVQVGWDEGRRVIRDAWTVEEGPENAYYIESGQPYHRETAG